MSRFTQWATKKKTSLEFSQRRKVSWYCIDSVVGLGPNVDFFSIQELEALAKKFKDEQMNPNGFDEEGKEENKRESTMAGFFDENMR